MFKKLAQYVKAAGGPILADEYMGTHSAHWATALFSAV
jgi:hypothetical protein